MLFILDWALSIHPIRTWLAKHSNGLNLRAQFNQLAVIGFGA